MPLQWFLFLSLIGSVLLLVDQSAAHDVRKAYVVYMGDKPKNGELVTPYHHVNILRDVVDNNMNNDISHESLLLHSYKKSFHGFAAMLTEKEAQKLARFEGVVSIFPSKKRRVKTTKSWDFIGFPQTVETPPLQRDVIIGVLDSGIWPESDSFSDAGFSPPPKKWKGICQGNNNFTCNNKIIGARYYRPSNSSEGDSESPQDEEGDSESPKPEEIDSPRDSGSHGTHCASIAAGNPVKNASQNGLGLGTARGGAPLARIAAYKICWNDGCDDADILRAYDDAIDDGVDIVSASLGGDTPHDYMCDGNAIGSFHAMKNGIFVSTAGGNEGPKRNTISNHAPWQLDVAAATINRRFITKVELGNGKIYEGLLPNPFDLQGKFFKLIYGGDAPKKTKGGEDDPKSRYCFKNSLDEKLVKGAIVLCDRAKDNVADVEGIKSAGGIGIIFTTDKIAGDDLEFYNFPSVNVGLEDNSNIYKYINQTSNPTATMWKSQEIDDVLAPYVSNFSSRGPNSLNPNIFKPDLAAPGSHILAAVSPIGEKGEYDYAIMSGTSMACPHASGVAAYVKSVHPEWSPAAIKSALITTAKPMSARTSPDAEFAYGAGLINPSRAPHPGLVYDLNVQDYIDYLCSLGYKKKLLEDITGDKNISCSFKSDNETSFDLNYPSFALPIKDPEKVDGVFHRTVTNVGLPKSTYQAKVTAPLGLKINVEPNELSFTSLEEKKSFVVTVKGPIERSNIVSASLVWDDGRFQVRSPIVVYVVA